MIDGDRTGKLRDPGHCTSDQLDHRRLGGRHAPASLIGSHGGRFNGSHVAGAHAVRVTVTVSSSAHLIRQGSPISTELLPLAFGAAVMVPIPSRVTGIAPRRDHAPVRPPARPGKPVSASIPERSFNYDAEQKVI